jgi:hypothetical protein
MTRLLIPEPPLQVLPSLAVMVGLNEAIVLQQMHYWLSRSQYTHEGRKWIYNSTDEWAAQFPFWSEATVKRALSSLKEQGFIEVRKLSEDRRDRTNYYTIVYERLTDPTGERCIGSNCTDGSGQIDPTHRCNLTRCLKEQETTQETTTREKSRAQARSPAGNDPQPPKDPASSRQPPKPAGVTDDTWRDWLALRKRKRAAVTPTVVEAAQAEAQKAGMPLEAFLVEWCLRGSQGLKAAWLDPRRMGGGPPLSAVERVKAANAAAGYPDDDDENWRAADGRVVATQ